MFDLFVVGWVKEEIQCILLKMSIFSLKSNHLLSKHPCLKKNILFNKGVEKIEIVRKK